MLGCFAMIVDTFAMIVDISYILTNTKPLIFRIPRNKSIPNIAWRCFNFSLFIEGHSNLDCLQGRVGKRKDIKIIANY